MNVRTVILLIALVALSSEHPVSVAGVTVPVLGLITAILLIALSYAKGLVRYALLGTCAIVLGQLWALVYRDLGITQDMARGIVGGFIGGVIAGDSLAK